MLEDWNKGVVCVRQSVQEVEKVKNDDGIPVLKQITTKIVNGASNVLLLFV